MHGLTLSIKMIFEKKITTEVLHYVLLVLRNVKHELSSYTKRHQVVWDHDDDVQYYVALWHTYLLERQKYFSTY